MSHSTRTLAELRQHVFGGDTLTRGEMRYLKTLMSRFHTDLIGELPVELVITIALHLKPKEFALCLRVSRAWRQQFLSDSVMAAYARQSWPALIKGAVNQSSFLGMLSKIGLALCCFPFPRAEKIDTEFVSWGPDSHYPLDSEFHPQADDVPSAYTQCPLAPYDAARDSVLYASGKAAWHLCSNVVVIDDIRLRTRKVLTPPSGTMVGSTVKLEALGSRLVIGTIGRLLIAWDHVDNVAHEKWLPGRTLRCSTQDNQVAIVLHGGDILVWSPGHAVRQLNTSNLVSKLGLRHSVVEAWRAGMHVFFAPHKDGTLYLASGYFCRPDPLMNHVIFDFTVHEFSGTDHVATWSATYRHRDVPVDRFQHIIAMEYDFAHGCIFLGAYTARQYNEPIVLFDKVKRKLVPFDISTARYPLEDPTYELSDDDGCTLFSPHYLDLSVSYDLDFMLNSDRDDGYVVVRPLLTQAHTEEKLWMLYHIPGSRVSHNLLIMRPGDPDYRQLYTYQMTSDYMGDYIPPNAMLAADFP
ncbi:hypothetical protein GGR50DRAFT_500358 [Xylaria sp. CBS 124048]|nr:hypothetical protein GGR50DRAFT_500358 [Xylaria sp. CBS 124048]